MVSLEDIRELLKAEIRELKDDLKQEMDPIKNTLNRIDEEMDPIKSNLNRIDEELDTIKNTLNRIDKRTALMVESSYRDREKAHVGKRITIRSFEDVCQTISFENQR